MARAGRQTWVFDNAPAILSTGTVAGKLEGEGPLGNWFDVSYKDDRLHHDTWEHAEQAMFNQAANTALEKANLGPNDLDLMIGADLNAQLSSFYFGLRSFSVPTLGVYSACASICESLALAALCVDTSMANTVLAGTSSHNSTAERQFRFPTEYGAQKPPTAQRTVTGSGVAIIGKKDEAKFVIRAATIGQVVDLGIQSPWEMGAAMAPAAADTLRAHLADTGSKLSDFDCIATGDLGFIGHDILKDLLTQEGLYTSENLTDCGMLIYNKDQSEVFSGGSGGACCSLVTFSFLLREMLTKGWNRMLVSATGALLSSVTALQKDTIPCVSHAIVFERREA